MSLRLRVAIGAALTVVILLAGGWEMNHEASLPGCQPLSPQPDVVGADYNRGVWTRDGALIGFSLEEDSIIVNDADCV